MYGAISGGVGEVQTTKTFCGEGGGKEGWVGKVGKDTIWNYTLSQPVNAKDSMTITVQRLQPGPPKVY